MTYRVSVIGLGGLRFERREIVCLVLAVALLPGNLVSLWTMAFSWEYVLSTILLGSVIGLMVQSAAIRECEQQREELLNDA